jgi:TonB-dependent starch-binding outer membrane protein SusC
MLACVVAALAVTACGTRPSKGAAPTPRTGTSSDTHVEGDRASQSFSRIEELIEGRAPGVRVIRHQDGSFRLRIRGISSPSGRNDPLVVIDGTPTSEFRPGSALASLNPQDVVRIDVLKDAASTAFYGMRGANGVIVITTRQQ